MPSKKSNTAPMMMHSRASFASPAKAKAVATQPEKRLQQVTKLGMCFFIFSFFYVVYRVFILAMTVWSPVVACPIFTQTSESTGRKRSTRLPSLMKPRCSSM